VADVAQAGNKPLQRRFRIACFLQARDRRLNEVLRQPNDAVGFIARPRTGAGNQTCDVDAER